MAFEELSSELLIQICDNLTPEDLWFNFRAGLFLEKFF